jgi:hypothetical protein
MKRVFIVLMTAFVFFSCESSNSRVLDFHQLPAKAQSFIKTHFADKEITLVFSDDDFIDRDYEVSFADGTKVDFNKNGEWTSVDMGKNGSVPADIMPANINSYVTARHPNSNVVDIDKDFFEYKVELSNGIEIVFEKDGDFKRYDD